ncbi:MAG: AraC family transcriptional regulator [Cyanobacteria bacterium J06635_15]
MGQQNTMAIALEDFLEIRTIAQQKGAALCRRTAFESENGLPPSLGEGSERLISLRGGLTLKILKGKLQQTVRHERKHESNFPLVAKFYVSGSSRVQTKGPIGSQADYVETAGCHYLYHLPDIAEVEEWPSHELHQMVMVSAQSDYFRAFSSSQTPLAPTLRRLLEGDETQRFHQSLGQITPTMSQALQQILQAPYQGMMQQLYLESKALELLALQFAHWAEEPSSERCSVGEALPTRRLPADELDQLHAAKAILTRDVSDPLPLSDIAQQVGLNEYRLKQGFRQVFGTTVFGYLHHCRMQQAQHLLRNSNLTIAGVAVRIGYRNPEAFSTAFRRKFAISPKAYQLGKHG